MKRVPVIRYILYNVMNVPCVHGTFRRDFLIVIINLNKNAWFGWNTRVVILLHVFDDSDIVDLELIVLYL